MIFYYVAYKLSVFLFSIENNYVRYLLAGPKSLICSDMNFLSERVFFFRYGLGYQF